MNQIYISGSEYEYFELMNERKLNRTQKFYTYKWDEIYSIKEMRCTNWKNNLEYGKLNFTREGDREWRHRSNILVTSHNGLKVSYHFKEYLHSIPYQDEQNLTQWNHYYYYYIDHVKRPHKPDVYYQYVNSENYDQHWMLSRKSKPNQRYLGIEYYQHGKNQVGDREVKILKRGLVVDRVMLLKAPVGIDARPIITHRFFYRFYFDKRNNVTQGVTEVRDALNRKIEYNYNAQDRPIAIARFVNENIYSFERYLWGAENTHENGNLKTKYIENNLGEVLKAKVFEYDLFGNILESKEYGKVTGKACPQIVIDSSASKPAENGAEYYKRTFKYYPDGYNNLEEEREGNGNAIYYGYKEKSDALVSKIYVEGNGHIYLREFYDYDDNHFLLRKQVDDGYLRPRENCDGATSIKVTYYSPRTSYPFGLSERIDEMYADPITGQEYLSHRVINCHNTLGQLEKQTHYDSLGNFLYDLLWEYNPHGLVTKETNALGESIFRNYDENDNLIFQKGPCSDFETTYEYDFSDRLIKTTEKHGSDHFVTQYKYDLVGNLISEIDQQGNETQHVYDELNRLIETVHPQVQTEPGQTAIPREKFEYDTLGHVIAYTDKCGYTTKKTCNINGDPLSIAYPNGTTEKFQYNPNGSLQEHVSTQGCVTRYQRDGLNRIMVEEIFSSTGELLAQKQFSYNGFNLTSETDAEGHLTTYHYDLAGRLIGKHSGNEKSTYEYDSLNRISSEKEWISNSEAKVTAYKYDLLNRVIEEKTQDLSGQTFSCLEYTYNVFGKKIAVKNGEATQRTMYNSHQDPIVLIDAEGNETHVDYIYQFSNGFNQRVTQIATTDPLGKKTIKTLDVLGRTAHQCTVDAFGTLLAQHEYYYSLENDLVLVKNDRIVDGDIKNSIYNQWTYSSDHQVLTLTEAIHTPEQRQRSYEYNELGQKTILHKPDGQSLHYKYDQKGRIESFYSSDNTVSYNYTYNKIDQITEVLDLVNNTTTKRFYDSQGRLESETQAQGLCIKYTCDNLDRVTKLILPDQSAINYSYDVVNLKQVQRKNYTHKYVKFDERNNLLQSTLPYYAGAINYSYDILDREKCIQHPKRTQTIPPNGFDKVGNLLKYTSEDDFDKTDHKFTYDELYQLTSEISFEDHHYQYDSLNNRTLKDGLPSTSNHLNQLLTESNVNFTYDLNGNLIEKNDHGKITKYQYDALSRLIKSITPTQTVAYTYDAFNRRLTKSGPTEEKYLYYGQNEIAIYKTAT